MVDHFREHISTRKVAYTGAAARGKSTAWLRLAEASANVDAARLLLDRDLVALQREAASGAHVAATIERARYDVAFIVDRCAHAVDTLFAGSGGRARYDSNRLQRCFRDMHAID